MGENGLQSPLVDEKPRGNRWHWFRLYLDIDKFTEIINIHSGVINHCHYILHDRDYKDDGEEVKPHIHCLLYLYDFKPSSVISKWFPDDCGIRHFNVREPPIAMRYLIHLGFRGKYQYDVEECLHIGSTADFFKALAEYDKGFDRSVMALDELLRGARWYDVAKKYGRDFIFHVQHFKKLIEIIGTDFHIDNPDNDFLGNDDVPF